MRSLPGMNAATNHVLLPSTSGGVAGVTGVTIAVMPKLGRRLTQDTLLGSLRNGLWRNEGRDVIAGTMHSRPPACHGFVQAVHEAFAKELDLILRPDDIQLAIVLLVSKTVAKNPDTYRSKLGLKNQQQQIVVVCDVQMNDPIDVATPKWAQVFPMFAKKIAEHCDDTPIMKSIRLAFSTTTSEDQLIRDIVLMETVKSSFKFVAYTKCGIPNVHLLGTIDDWQNLQTSLDAYVDVDMGDWVKAAKVVLQHFIDAYSGKVDKNFWESIYKFKSVSGTNKSDGWALLFAGAQLMPETEWSKHQFVKTVTNVPELGTGFANLDFQWNHIGTIHQAKLVAGFAQPLYHPSPFTSAIQPSSAWAIKLVKQSI